MKPILIYGATGYTGHLAAEHAAARGLTPVLAGRNAKKLAPLAARLGLAWQAFALDDAQRLRAALAQASAVLHVAGPFSATARPMVEACLATGVPYCDLTGEIAVLEAIAALDARAKAAGIALLPGAGFDVVPSDCLLVHVARRLPDATRLRLSVGGVTKMSRGTAKTLVEAVTLGTLVRAGGRIVDIGKPPRATADFGAGPRRTLGVSWGDVATAWHSTGVPDIETFFEANPGQAIAARLPGWLKAALGTPLAQAAARRLIERALPPGPSPAHRASARSVFVAEAWNAAGRRVAGRLEMPEPYRLTAMTAVEIARRLAAGEVAPGYRTPATAFGADFILGFDGVRRIDV